MIIIFPKYIHNRFSLCVIEKFYVIYSQIVNIINKVCWRSLFNKVLVLLILSNLWFCVVYQISQNSSWTLNYWTYLNQNWAVCTCHSYPALQPSSPLFPAQWCQFMAIPTLSIGNFFNLSKITVSGPLLNLKMCQKLLCLSMIPLLWKFCSKQCSSLTYLNKAKGYYDKAVVLFSVCPVVQIVPVLSVSSSEYTQAGLANPSIQSFLHQLLSTNEREPGGCRPMECLIIRWWCVSERPSDGVLSEHYLLL